MHTRIALVVLALAVVAAAAWAGPIAPAQAQDSAQGCPTCHEDLISNLPEGHPKITLNDVAFCLPCHGAQGSARALVWITHLNHYSQEDFPGDCLSCHTVAEGEMLLVGAPTPVTEATPTPEPTPTATPTQAATASPGARPTRTPRPTPTPIPLDEDRALEMTEYFQSWATSEFGDHTHALAAVTCDQCHESFFPERAPQSDRCLTCHGSYAHLAELTAAGEGEPNPHASHLGELRCSNCHMGHEEAVVLCLDCHVFEMEMPEWSEE
ncbi:MAG: cytochrome c3 family protein [Anaerolineae bacterium]|jgi:hypothetical protein